MFIDGGLKTSGNYYHLAFMFNGQTHSGIGPTPMSNPVKWSAQLTPKANGIRALITLPLAEIGVNISQGNKLGGMFIVNGGAWNGGQWHSPTGFQNILLQMD